MRGEAQSLEDKARIAAATEKLRAKRQAEEDRRRDAIALDSHNFVRDQRADAIAEARSSTGGFKDEEKTMEIPFNKDEIERKDAIDNLKIEVNSGQNFRSRDKRAELAIARRNKEIEQRKKTDLENRKAKEIEKTIREALGM